MGDIITKLLTDQTTRNASSAETEMMRSADVGRAWG
jgi:hypothetical protein